MKRTILLAAIALCGCKQLKEATDPSPAYSEHQLIGGGEIVKSPEASVLVGPASFIYENGSIPIFVQKGPPIIEAHPLGLSCILLDEHNLLAASGGGFLPPQHMGGNINITLKRPVKSGTLRCVLFRSSALITN